jgi:hypothetical protein
VGRPWNAGAFVLETFQGGTVAEIGDIAIIVGDAAICADEATVTVVTAPAIGVEIDVPLPSSADGFSLAPFLLVETGPSQGLFSFRDSSNLRTFSLASFITDRTYSIASGSVAPISTMSAKY